MRPWLVLACALLGALLVIVLVRPGPSEDAGARHAGSPSAARQPNVILYLVDTLRADHLGVHGYRRETSPVLDRWARGAVVFDRAYSPCSWTKPSVVSLFTGLDPVTHGVEDRLDVIPRGLGLLSEHLKAKGG